jgi:hypothetical protein
MEQFLLPFLMTVIISSFSVLGLAQVSKNTDDLEANLKTAFNKFKQAVVEKNEDQLKASMATSSYMKMKNMSIARKMSFPKDFFEGMGGNLYGNIDLSKFKTLKALKDNGTALLVMLATKDAKFDPFGSGDPQAMLFIISFIDEGSIWKFNEAQMEGLEDAEESKLMAGDLAKLNDDRYKPSGIVPSIPAEESVPDYDYDAVLNIVFGEKVEVTLNGKTYPTANGSRATRIGVKKGVNTIVIKCATSSSLKISIVARKGDTSEPVKVFDLDISKPDPLITKTFSVAFD